MILSAQDICRTAPWCLAAGCPEDGGPTGYCRRHQDQLAQGKPVRIHVVEQPTLPDQDTHLWCATCPGGGQWKLDAQFNVKTGSSPSRRDRRSECSQCGIDKRARLREEAANETTRNQRLREAAS